MSHVISNLYEFGDFRFDAETNTLWRMGELVALSPKALELLRVIVERRGEIISKQAIFDAVWQDTFVEEGVLTQNIYTLRKTLGTDASGNQIIENIARRGYRLNVPVKFSPKTSEDHDREVLSVILTEQEILDEVSVKKAAARKSFYKRKSFAFAASILIAVIFGAAFGFRMFRQQVWAYFHPPLENVQLQKVTDSGNANHPAISQDGAFLAYVREAAIFLKDLKSGKEIKLEIPNVENFGSLVFSPSGDAIYFRNTHTLRKTANILQVSRFGGETRLVAEKTWGDFGVAPDGKRLAFIRKSADAKRQQLIVKSLETGEEKTLLTRDYPDFFYYRGTLSFAPDSSRIAFVANAGTERSTRLFVADAVTGKEEEIKSTRLRAFEQAVWTPDGETLIVSATETGRKFQLWKILYPSGYVQRITSSLDNFGSLSISKDGKNLLAAQTTENSNLWTADGIDLTAQKQLTTGNSNNDGQTSLNWLTNEKVIYSSTDEILSDVRAMNKPYSVSNLKTQKTTDDFYERLTTNLNFHSDFGVASADGKHVYFNSNRDRRINIWRIDATGENLTQITDGTDGLQLFPAVSPDGNYLYYLFRNREQAVIKRLNLTENKEETFFQSERIVPAAFITISPDGKYLAFLNLNADADDDTDENNFQFVVVSTADTNDIQFFNVKGNGATARF